MSDYWNGPPERDASDPLWKDPVWVAKAEALSERLRVSSEMVQDGAKFLQSVRHLDVPDEEVVAQIYRLMNHNKKPLVGPRWADQFPQSS